MVVVVVVVVGWWLSFLTDSSLAAHLLSLCLPRYPPLIPFFSDDYYSSDHRTTTTKTHSTWAVTSTRTMRSLGWRRVRPR